MLESLTCAVTAGWLVVDLDVRHFICVGWNFSIMAFLVRGESTGGVLWQGEAVLWE